MKKRKQRSWKSEYNNIKKMYENFHSQNDIAKKYNTTPSIIWDILNRLKVKKRSLSEAQNLSLKNGNKNQSPFLSKYKNIQNLYKSGLSEVEISKKFNCAQTTINRIINKTIGSKSYIKTLKFTHKKNREKLIILRVIKKYKKIINRYCKGESTNDISKTCGISLSKVSSILISAKIKMRSMSESAKLRVKNGKHDSKLQSQFNKIKNEYKDGATCVELADRYKVHHTTIKHILSKLVKFRTRHENYKISMSKGKLWKSPLSSKFKDIKAMYKKGMSPQEIGKVIGASRSGVRLFINRTIGGRNVKESRLLMINKGKLKDKNNPAWLEDRTKITAKRSFYEERMFFKKILLERDYTCELTGTKGGKLSVHHIKSVNAHKSLQFVKSNVIVIQRKIHKLFHELYGVWHFTKQDWDYFVSHKEYLKTIKQLKKEKLLPFNLKYKINLVNSVEPNNILYQKVA